MHLEAQPAHSPDVAWARAPHGVHGGSSGSAIQTRRCAPPDMAASAECRSAESRAPHSTRIVLKVETGRAGPRAVAQLVAIENLVAAISGAGARFEAASIVALQPRIEVVAEVF